MIVEYGCGCTEPDAGQAPATACVVHGAPVADFRTDAGYADEETCRERHRAFIERLCSLSGIDVPLTDDDGDYAWDASRAA